LQAVLASPRLYLEQRKVVSKSDVADEFGSLQRYVYDLDAGQTIRILLLSESKTSHTLLIGYYHINMDGISLAVLIRDLDKVYKGVALAPTVLQYPNFSARQRRCYTSDNIKRKRAY
jgi:hybrid polyketide synthase / nonribosomal peptide synthetase ACE1